MDTKKDVHVRLLSMIDDCEDGKELFRNNMYSLRRIFLRGCISKNVGVAGYGEAF